MKIAIKGTPKETADTGGVRMKKTFEIKTVEEKMVLKKILNELVLIKKELRSIRNEKGFTVPMLINGREFARVTKNCYRLGNRG